MQTINIARPISNKNEPKAVSFKSGRTTVKHAQKKAERKKSLPFSLNKSEQVFKQIKLINMFSSKTYSITTFIFCPQTYFIKKQSTKSKKILKESYLFSQFLSKSLLTTTFLSATITKKVDK